MADIANFIVFGILVFYGVKFVFLSESLLFQ